MLVTNFDQFDVNHNAFDVQGHVLRTWYNLPALCSYFNSCWVSDVQHVEL